MELRRWLLILMLCVPAAAQTTVFTCSSFTTTNTSCGVGGIIAGSGTAFKVVGSQNGSSPSVTGGAVSFPTGSNHVALNFNYQTAVDVRAFTTTFTYTPNGENLAFVINNCGLGSGSGIKSCGTNGGQNFSTGASCEGSFSQSAVGSNVPYNVFAMQFDSDGFLQATDSNFTYSNVQIYQQNQSPCNPASINTPIVPYWSTTKFSTSPVAMNSPSNTQNTCLQTVGGTCDTYSATITYDGSTVTLNLFDVTAGGSCPGASCFTKTWSNVSIPSQAGGTTGFIGLALATGIASSFPLNINSWSYTVNAATASPSSTATAAGSSTAPNPTFSPVAGSYSGTQSVTISCPSAPSGANICYNVAAAGQSILPQPDNLGSCNQGTSYSGPVSIAASNTLYATCGVNNNTTAGYLPSGYVQGAYTITGVSTTKMSGVKISGATIQ